MLIIDNETENKMSLETELFFVKTHIIHALAETTSDSYCHEMKNECII